MVASNSASSISAVRISDTMRPISPSSFTTSTSWKIRADISCSQATDIKLLNPNTRTCPIFRTRRDAEITKSIYRRVPVLIDRTREGDTGNPWNIAFKTMFHQTNDAELFREADALKKDGCKLKGNRWINGKQIYLPLYEAKMLQGFDHRAADVVTDKANWVRQGQTEKTSLVSYAESRAPRDSAILGELSGNQTSDLGITWIQGHHEPDQSTHNDCGLWPTVRLHESLRAHTD